MASGSSRLQANNATVGIQNQGNVHVAGNVIVQGSSQGKQIELQEYNFPPLINSFRGREEDIEQLDSLFFQQNKNKVVVCGVPGYGKSELAKQFAKKCLAEGKVQKIFWVNAENMKDFYNFFKDLLKILNMPELESKPQDVVYKCLAEYKTMIVFDNGISRSTIVDFEPPQTDNFWLLITSQTKDWGNDVMSYELDCLTSDAAVEVLSTNLGSYYKKEDRELYRELAELFGNVPLGLQVSSAYVLQELKSTSPYFMLQEYINEIKQNVHTYMDAKISENSRNTYKNSLYRAFKMSYEKLSNHENTDLSDLTSKVLYVCAFLDPEHITLYDLLKMPNIQKLLSKLKNGRTILRKILNLIDNFSFIKYDPNGCRIRQHRFIQEIVRYHMRASDEQARVQCYDACLEFLLNFLLKYEKHIGNMHIEICFHSVILKYADENADTFYKFYQRNKELLIRTPFNSNSKIFRNILIGLIKWNCVDSLQKLLNDVREENAIISNNNDIKLNTISRIFRRACTKKVSDNIEKYNSDINVILEAGRSNNLDEMKLLLEYDAGDINSKHIVEKTLLHVAALNWDFETIKFLIQQGADLNARNDFNETPLSYFLQGAFYHTHVDFDEVADIVDLLIGSENVTSNFEYALLHFSTNSLHIKLIILLLTKCYLDVNRLSRYGATILHIIVVVMSEKYYNYYTNEPRKDSDHHKKKVNWEEIIQLVETLKSCGARFDEADDIHWMPVQVPQLVEEYFVPYLFDHNLVLSMFSCYNYFYVGC